MSDQISVRVRPMCPFYGFTPHTGGNLVDNRGNACALHSSLGHYRPCMMEMSDKSPKWKECFAFNKPESEVPIRALMNIITVHLAGVEKPVSGNEWFEKMKG